MCGDYDTDSAEKGGELSDWEMRNQSARESVRYPGQEPTVGTNPLPWHDDYHLQLIKYYYNFWKITKSFYNFFCKKYYERNKGFNA